VDRWDGPTSVEGKEEAVVRYSYKVEHLADWAKTPVVGSAFPFVANTLSGASQQQLSTTLILTEKGWVAKTP
jgi:hypothetical protein